ncbi:MAG: protein translocase subunit SecF, partial [Alphaproteobacteria bacterium]|nr:protein translocase subunit SecF [Alphaproteobacteria bacterium]
MALQLIPYNTNINFVGGRIYTFIIALMLTVMGFAGYYKGLNFGVDFKGGHVIEVHVKQAPDLSALRQKLAGLHLGDIVLQEMGSPVDLMIKVESQEGNQEAQSNAIERIKGVLGTDQEYRKISTVGPKVGDEMVQNAIKAVAFAMAAMLIYIAIRFEWQ